MEVSRGGLAEDVFANNPFVAAFTDDGGILPDEIARGHGHAVQRVVQGLELPLDPRPKPELFCSAAEVCWVTGHRNSWNSTKPICVLSTSAITDRDIVAGVDWQRVVDILGVRFTVVQPVLQECVLDSVIPCRNLTVRQFIALISIADAFCGGSSGGAHVAAAFDIPSLIVTARASLNRFQTPYCGSNTMMAFLYPQHWLVATEDIGPGRFIESLLEQKLSALMAHGKPGRPLALENCHVNPCGFSPTAGARILMSGSRLRRFPVSRYGEVAIDKAVLA